MPKVFGKSCGFFNFPSVGRRMCDLMLQWISSFLERSQTHGQDCLLFLRHREASSSRGKNNRSLASLVQYLLLPKQKSGQEQDFLLITISLELFMSRSRQGMAKVNTKIGIISPTSVFWNQWAKNWCQTSISSNFPKDKKKNVWDVRKKS